MSIKALTKEDKQNLFKEYGGSTENSGSVEAQVALFTKRIEHLTAHLKVHKKDHSTRRSLVLMVGKRRKFLAYLKRKDINKYRALIAKLGLRR